MELLSLENYKFYGTLICVIFFQDWIRVRLDGD